MPRLKSIIFAVFILYSLDACPQNLFIKGCVWTDIANLPLSNTLVYIDAMPYESHTNGNGEYILCLPDTLIGYSVLLIAHKSGYADDNKTIEINKQSVCNFNLMKIDHVDQVIVTGRRKQQAIVANDAIIDMSEIQKTSIDLSVTSAIRGSHGAQVQDRGEGIVVRGGIGSETGFIFDGINVVDFFNTSAENERQTSRFSTKIFKTINYSAGGFSSKYGQYMSSAISLESQDMPIIPLNIDFTISSIKQDFNFLKTLNDKNALGFGVSYSDMTISNAIFRNKNSLAKFTSPPRDYTSYLRYIFLLNKNTSLNFYGDISGTSYKINHPDISFLDTSNTSKIKRTSSFFLLSLNHSKNNHKILFSNAIQYLKNEQNSLTEQSANIKKYNNSILQFQSHLEWLYSKNIINILLGGDVIYNQTSLQNNQSVNNFYTAGFTDITVNVHKNIGVTAGARYEYNKVNGESLFQPRAHIVYTNRYHVLKYDVGLYSQLPQAIYLANIRSLKNERSIHNILSYEYERIQDKNIHINLALYSKNYKRLILYNTDPTIINNNGYGYAYGTDAYIAYYNVFGGLLSASYSWVNSNRLFHDYPKSVQPSFISTHNIQLKYLKYFNRLSTFLHVQYSYASGKPYAIPNQAVEFFMSSTLHSYNNLSVTAAYLTRIARTQAVIALSFDNILNTQNIVGYQFSATSSIEPIAIYPMFNRIIYLGITFNFNFKSKKEIERELFGTK